MNEQIHKEMIYLASVDVLRRLAIAGNVEMKILERLNLKNAETMDCKVVSII